MRLPTVTLTRKSDGKKIKVNAWDYSTNMQKYLKKGYKIRHEQLNVDTPAAAVENAAKEDRIEEKRRRNPNSPAFGDPKREYEFKNQSPPEVSTEQKPEVDRGETVKRTVSRAKKATGRKATDDSD
jgi:hypothetical protein